MTRKSTLVDDLWDAWPLWIYICVMIGSAILVKIYAPLEPQTCMSSGPQSQGEAK